MLTLWVFFRHTYWHNSAYCSYLSRELNFEDISSFEWYFTVLFTISLQHCPVVHTDRTKKKARRIKRYQKEFTVDGCTRNSIFQFSLATNIHGSPQWRYRCCSTSNLLIPSHYTELHWRLSTVPQIFFCQETFPCALLGVLSNSAPTSRCSDFILIAIFNSV